MSKRFAFLGKQSVVFEEFGLSRPQQHEVKVRTLASLMSTGTENIIFNRLFEKDSHWDRWIEYPFYPGYSVIGEIEELGPDVEGLKKGDRVAIRAGHASHHLVKDAGCTLIPDKMDPKVAAWFALAKIAFMGAKAAQYSLGSGVLIIGAGPIGQMSVRWANAAGVYPILVADTELMRLELAKNGGATHVMNQAITGDQSLVSAAMGGNLPSIVIDTTGNAQVFSLALPLVAKFGRIVLLGDTGFPAQQHLSSDVILNGLTIVAAHDSHITSEWTEARVFKLFFDLCHTNRFSLDDLNTHVFKAAQCTEAYRIANEERGKSLGIVFDWT